jgi:hypothetical protein
MTTKAAFSPEEWKVVLEGPPTAGMIVITAAHGGMFRESKATAQERDDYRRFVLALADKVAAAHREHGQSVSPAEAQAIEQITAALGASPQDG